jgi:hypothetical protein
MNAERLPFINFIYSLVHGKRKLKRARLDEQRIQFICDRSFYSEQTGELDTGAVF